MARHCGSLESGRGCVGNGSTPATRERSSLTTIAASGDGLVGYDRDACRHAHRQRPAGGRSGRVAVVSRDGPVVPDRHRRRDQGAAAQPRRHVARVTAASGRDPDPGPGILVADPQLHGSDQWRPLCRVHRTRALCPSRPASSAAVRRSRAGSCATRAICRPFSYGVGAYELLKTATQVFLLLECGGCHAEIKNLDPDDESARFGEQVTLEDLRTGWVPISRTDSCRTSSVYSTAPSRAKRRSPACIATACSARGSRCRACSS